MHNGGMGASVLVTGFEPWAQFAVNSSGEVVRALARRFDRGQVRCEVLAVDYAGANMRMVELLEEVRPAVCLAMGMWQGSAFRIERVGRRCPGLSHVAGEEELRGEWDWVGMERVLGGGGWAVVLSEDAGRFVCDTTYWTVLDFRRRRGWPGRAGFLHVPPVSEVFTVEGMAGVVGEIIENTGW